MNAPIAAITLAVMLTGGGPSPRIPFDLARPDRAYTLPPELMEVSALTDVDANTVACVQDEAAMLYFLDLRDGRITRRISFGAPGDLEGLTRVGQEYFALRSDGLIYHMIVSGEQAQLRDTFHLDLPNRNIEGLGYDERNKRILISPKDFEKGSPEVRDNRVIHAYDPVARKLTDAPALVLSVRDIVTQAQKAGIAVPMRMTDNGREVPAIKLRFSSVAVDPISDLYYLLSASDHVLLVLDRQGKLVALHTLDPTLFYKPEGITFLPSGELLISNEGRDRAPNLLRFARRG